MANLRTMLDGAPWGRIATVTFLGSGFLAFAILDAGAAAAMLFLGVTLGAGVWLAPRLLVSIRWHRPIRLLRDPVPELWADIVRVNVPISKQLSEPDFDRLLKLIQVFLHQKHVEGAGGLEVTDEIRVTIAAQACLLLVWRDTGMFPGLTTVIVYPEAVVPRHVQRIHGTMTLETEPGETALLGESWGNGVVVLSWDSARQGAFDPRDGHNVVLHEFAHQLDQETGEADGIPAGMPLSALKPWAEVMEERFRQLRSARSEGRRTVMRSYGATNHAEFFAVATEAFFEKPRQLRTRKPDLYDILSDFYGVDPAEGMSRIGDATVTSPDA